MQLTWYGTASLVFKAEDTVIAFDPFSKLSPKGLSKKKEPIPYEDAFREAKHIFITHGHFDHIMYIPSLYRDLPAMVFGTVTPCRTLIHRGFPPEKCTQIAPGFSCTVGPVQVNTWQSRHCHFDAPLVLQKIFSRRSWRHAVHFLHILYTHLHFPERGEILFYELSCQGLRIQILGSMNLDPDIAYPTGADFLIMAFQGRSDQDLYALDLVERLKPKQLLLDHYDDAYPPMTDAVNLSNFIQNVTERFQIPCSGMIVGKTLTLTKE